MLKEAIRHMHSRDFCYSIGDGIFVIRLITARDDFDSVNYIYKDKYPNKPHNEFVSQPMTKIASDSLFDYYEIHYKNDFLATRYCFELKDGPIIQYYSNYHFYDEIPHTDDYFFTMPKRMHEIDALTDIEWMNSGIVYQIFPDRFCRGSNTPAEGLCDWYKKPVWNDKFGGTIKGITEKLDYIKELGADIIYLTPIFMSPSSHKYDTTDYMKIDPDFGTEEDFQELVNQVHARKMKIILDCVIDHCGSHFKPFEDLISNGENSPYKDWFHVNKFPIGKSMRHTHDYEGFSYFGGMPKLNVDNDDVRSYFSKMIHHWMEKFDVDGWRLDVADEVAHTFWAYFNREVKSIKPDAPIIGEVWYDTADWLNGSEFDSTMNYPFMLAVNSLIAKKQSTPSQFLDELGFIRGNTNYSAYNMLWNLLDSHDSTRFLRCCNDDIESFKLAVLLQMTCSGTPMIYYGDEIGMTGDGDPDCRRGMIWDEKRQNKELLSYYRTLISIRKSHPALYMGQLNTVFTDDDNDILIFSKTYLNATFYIAINNSPADYHYDGINKKTDIITGRTMTDTLPAMTGIIYK